MAKYMDNRNRSGMRDERCLQAHVGGKGNGGGGGKEGGKDERRGLAEIDKRRQTLEMRIDEDRRTGRRRAKTKDKWVVV